MNEQRQPLIVGGMVCIGICVAIVIGALVGYHFKPAPKADPRRASTDSPVTMSTSPHGVTPTSPPLPISNGGPGPTQPGWLQTNGIPFKPLPTNTEPARVGWGQEQIQNEMERVHAALPKKLAVTPTLPAFSPIKHTQSIPQVLVQCTSGGAQQHLIWTNTLGMVAVAEGTAWLGVDMGAIEDAYVLAINLNSGDVWVVTNEDHYSDRTGGAASANIPFGGSPFPWLLNPGDQIELLIGCRGLANYHIGASLTFQYLSPAPAPVPAPAAQGK